jgi:transposase-like protein
MAHVPKVAMRTEVARDLRRIFDADETAEAERRLRDAVARYHKTAPQLAAWLEENVPEALTVLRIPAAHRRRLRTTNGLERLNKEIKRRTRVATLFPNEASLLRLASAVLSEISDDWETERSYLNMEAR